MFSGENSDIGEDVDDDYLITERVRVILPQSGDVLKILVEASVVLVVGTVLEAGGAGDLQILTTGRIMGFSLEAKTVGGGGPELTDVLIA